MESSHENGYFFSIVSMIRMSRVLTKSHLHIYGNNLLHMFKQSPDSN